MKTQDKLQAHYANFDFSNAKLVEPRLIKKIQQLKKEQNSVADVEPTLDKDIFDKDIVSWVAKQDRTIKDDINTLLRLYMRARMA